MNKKEDTITGLSPETAIKMMRDWGWPRWLIVLADVLVKFYWSLVTTVVVIVILVLGVVVPVGLLVYLFTNILTGLLVYCLLALVVITLYEQYKKSSQGIPQRKRKNDES